MFVTTKSVCKCAMLCPSVLCDEYISAAGQAESHDSGNALISGRILIKDDKCQSAWVISALIRLSLIRMLSDALISNTVTHKEPHSHLKLLHQPLIAHDSISHLYLGAQMNLPFTKACCVCSVFVCNFLCVTVSVFNYVLLCFTRWQIVSDLNIASNSIIAVYP